MKTSAQRQAAYKQRQINLGRVKRPVFATPEEHVEINSLLKRLRGNEN